MILVVLLLLIVVLWAIAYFGCNWQLNRNMRNYDEVIDADASMILALAAKGLIVSMTPGRPQVRLPD